MICFIYCIDVQLYYVLKKNGIYDKWKILQAISAKKSDPPRAHLVVELHCKGPIDSLMVSFLTYCCTFTSITCTLKPRFNGPPLKGFWKQWTKSCATDYIVFSVQQIGLATLNSRCCLNNFLLVVYIGTCYIIARPLMALSDDIRHMRISQKHWIKWRLLSSMILCTIMCQCSFGQHQILYRYITIIGNGIISTLWDTFSRFLEHVIFLCHMRGLVAT